MFSSNKRLSPVLYVIGIAVTFVAVYLQYFVRLGPVLGYLVVYGVPVTVASLFFGRQILSKAAKNNLLAAKLGLGLFGVFTVLGIFVAVAVFLVILQFNPQAIDLLNKPNPVLEVPAQEAWFLMVVSFLVVGPAEEYIFRGFMFGGLLSVFQEKRWLALTVVSSLMFAAVHGYYFVTYGVASVVPFIAIVSFGIAMSITYYWSKGNILVPALIHGAFDATGFLAAATTTFWSLVARGLLILIGLIFAAVFLTKKIRMKSYSQVPSEASASGSSPSNAQNRA